MNQALSLEPCPRGTIQSGSLVRIPVGSPLRSCSWAPRLLAIRRRICLPTALRLLCPDRAVTSRVTSHTIRESASITCRDNAPTAIRPLIFDMASDGSAPKRRLVRPAGADRKSNCAWKWRSQLSSVTLRLLAAPRAHNSSRARMCHHSTRAVE